MYSLWNGNLKVFQEVVSHFIVTLKKATPKAFPKVLIFSFFDEAIYRNFHKINLYNMSSISSCLVPLLKRFT